MENKINKSSISDEVMILLKEGNYEGNDNYGHRKTDYLQKLVDMNDEELYNECKHTIWLSAYASNNRKSDYHWWADACSDECTRRKKYEIYINAYKAAF